jgi:hypothetical protein
MDLPIKAEESRWQAALAVVAALVLYVTLPPKVIVGPVWVLPVVILVILVPLLILAPHRHREASWQRWASIAHIALLGAFNVGTIVLLFVWQISEHHRKHFSGEQLLVAAVQIWLTNVIVYALWFWEIDGRGPEVRAHLQLDQEERRADFLFPQMTMDSDVRARMKWKPKFVDYLFLSFTNATAFSPTDTFPLTRRAKILMMAEASKSLVTIAIIASRAVSLLGG